MGCGLGREGGGRGRGEGKWERTASPRCVLRSHVFWSVYSVVTSAASAERGRRRATAAREVGRRIVAGSGGDSGGIVLEEEKVSSVRALMMLYLGLMEAWGLEDWHLARLLAWF